MLKGDDEDNEDEDDNDYDNDEDDGSQSQCLYRSLVRHELTSHPPTLWSSDDNLQIICFDLKILLGLRDNFVLIGKTKVIVIYNT